MHTERADRFKYFFAFKNGSRIKNIPPVSRVILKTCLKRKYKGRTESQHPHPNSKGESQFLHPDWGGEDLDSPSRIPCSAGVVRGQMTPVQYRRTRADVSKYPFSPRTRQ